MAMNKQRMLLLGIAVLSWDGGIAARSHCLWRVYLTPSWVTHSEQPWREQTGLGGGLLGTSPKLLCFWRSVTVQHVAASCWVLPAFTARATSGSHRSFHTKHRLGEVVVGSPKASTSESGLARTQRFPESLTAGRGVTGTPSCSTSHVLHAQIQPTCFRGAERRLVGGMKATRQATEGCSDPIDPRP